MPPSHPRPPRYSSSTSSGGSPCGDMRVHIPDQRRTRTPGSGVQGAEHTGSPAGCEGQYEWPPQTRALYCVACVRSLPRRAIPPASQNRHLPGTAPTPPTTGRSGSWLVWSSAGPIVYLAQALVSGACHTWRASSKSHLFPSKRTQGWRSPLPPNRMPSGEDGRPGGFSCARKNTFVYLI